MKNNKELNTEKQCDILYRYGELSHWYNSWSYCIQEKRWYGWKTIKTYSRENDMMEAVEFMRKSGLNIIPLFASTP